MVITRVQYGLYYVLSLRNILKRRGYSMTHVTVMKFTIKSLW